MAKIPTRLTGEALLVKATEMKKYSKLEVLSACGYVGTNEDGSTEYYFIDYFQELF